MKKIDAHRAFEIARAIKTKGGKWAMTFQAAIFVLAGLLAGYARPAESLAEDESTSETRIETGRAEAEVLRPGDLKIYGTELSGDARAVYLPPTRAKDPFVATASEVFSWDAKARAWQAVFHADATQQPIQGVFGYARSSKALWIAHAAGISWSRDGGESWGNVIPPGWRNDPLRSLAVHPTNRKIAVAVQNQRAWWTETQGAGWTDLILPAESEPIVDVAWAGGESPRLVAMTTHGIYACENPRHGWQTLTRTTQGPSLLATSAMAPFAFAYFHADHTLLAWDLSRPGLSHAWTIEGSHGNQLLADPRGRPIVWLVDPGAPVIEAINLEQATATTREYPMLEHPTATIVHPRAQDQIFLTYGTRVAAIAVPTDPPALLAAIPNQLFSSSLENSDNTSQQPTSTASQPGTTSQADAQAALDAVLRNEPPLDEAIQAALLAGGNSQGEVKRWKYLVLTRNLLPDLRVEHGTKQITSSRNRTITEVDRFGIPSSHYLRENDDLVGADYNSISLNWDLSRLLFDEDEIKISDEARRRMDQRNALIKNISELYYDRLELLVDEHLNGAPTTTDAAVRWKLRKLRLSQTLNQLCGKKLFSE